MTKIFKATYANGVLTPSEPLGIEEGTEVTLSIDDAPVISPSRKPSPLLGLEDHLGGPGATPLQEREGG